MKPKKILCLIDSINSGGAQRQMVGLAKLLQDKRYIVKVMTYHDWPFYKPYLDKYQVEYQFESKAEALFTRIWYIRKAIKNYSPDIVIAYLNLPCIIATICKLLGGKFKLIVSERNTTQRLSKIERIKFFLYHWADSIVTNSFSQTAYIDRYFPHLSKKTHVITNFVDTDYFVPSVKYTKGNFSCKIICVGRIVRQKNILNFIEAINIVIKKGYQINIKWFGNKIDLSYYDQCCEKIATYKIQNVFTFHDHNPQIKKEYQEATLLCLPSLFEGFPNVICEAMSCGLVILCSDICDNPRIVKDGVNGFLFDPFNAENMANTIIKYVNLTSEEKTKMSQQNRQIAVDLFSSGRFIEQYLNIIE